MNATQADNLRTLIRHMDGQVARTLRMATFFTYNAREPNSCGTPACALGEATCVPALRDAGMDGWGGCFKEFHAPMHSAGATGPVFGLCEKYSARLFGHSYINAWRRDGVTPQEWAVEARAVLAEHGYSMDAKPDAFAAFMAKVQEPVAVTA